MGTIEIELFATLDLVGQAPGGPEEDPQDGFAFGGWQAPLFDDVTGAQVAAAYEGTDALLLGRRTYDIFAAYWPHQDDDFGRLFNRVPKYVATRGAPELSWAGSSRLGPDLAAGVQETVFDGGQVPTSLSLLEQPVAGPGGTVLLRYGRLDGEPGTGDMAA